MHLLSFSELCYYSNHIIVEDNFEDNIINHMI